MSPLDDIPVIDTHEHIALSYAWKPDQTGLLYVLMGNHYLLADMRAAESRLPGLAWDDPRYAPFGRLSDPRHQATTEEEREALDFYISRLPLVQLTSDWKGTMLALRDLFDFEGSLITPDNWERLDQTIKRRCRNREVWHAGIVEKARIRGLFWCYGPPKLAGECRGILSLDEFLLRTRSEADDAEGLRIAFERWMDESEAAFHPVALKFRSAYSRDLDLPLRDVAEVTAALHALGGEQTLASSTIVSDFVHEIAALRAGRSGLPVQVHTGYLFGNRYVHRMSEAHACRFEPFVARHRDTRFDLLHGSYPCWGEALALARRYPNVSINLCWVADLSESMAGAMLECALDSVPVNKILWGGDAHSLEMTYGVLAMFRGLLDRTLSRRGLSGELKRTTAEWILWRSASQIYSVNPTS